VSAYQNCWRPLAIKARGRAAPEKGERGRKREGREERLKEKTKGYNFKRIEERRRN
jgi:hypothetical protein